MTPLNGTAGESQWAPPTPLCDTTCNRNATWAGGVPSIATRDGGRRRLQATRACTCQRGLVAAASQRNLCIVAARRESNPDASPATRQKTNRSCPPSSKPGHPLSRVQNVSVNYAGMSCLPAPRSRWSYPWSRALRCLLRPTELSAAAVQRRERRGRATTPQPGRRGRMRAGLRAVISHPPWCQ